MLLFLNLMELPTIMRLFLTYLPYLSPEFYLFSESVFVISEISKPKPYLFVLKKPIYELNFDKISC